MPGGGSPRRDPAPEGLRVLRHGLQGARNGMSWGLRATVLPAHPQQAAEVRVPVHGRLLVRGRGGETLRVRLPPVFLGPHHRLPPAGPVGTPRELRRQEVGAEGGRERREY